ncbi:hypothetical protein HELRODRAFT_130520, partial [Helobdella robusta]|uniref:BK channel n=1 Tax=Helobdella robusta TaxID=6412 RepID=T1EHU0_HELRO
IDLVCNAYFLLHFVLKFIAANDKVKFWVKLTSVVDMFTIPPLVTAICLKSHWLGIRFICVIRLLNFHDVLQSLYILRSSNHVRLVQMFSIFFCIWVCSGGFIHLLENSGDPLCYLSPQTISIWECFYLIIITMSSVGYGDFYCKTILGKIFIIIFILGALAWFASFIPELFQILDSSRQKYLVEYKKEIGVRHLIVGGHISFSTVSSLMRNFTHNDRLNQNLKCVILDEEKPSLELDSLYKRYYNKIAYIKGSMMVIRDLKNARLASSEAVLILTNQSSECPDIEDTKNIMKAIAIKNYCGHAKVILQLLKSENKTICKNLPFWTSRDHIICFTEMKMAFMAAGCLAPGFSTFLSNLLLMFSYDKKNHDLESWQNEYLKGVDMEVYKEKFSTFFHDRPIYEVINFCYTRLRLLLVAVVDGCNNQNRESSKPSRIILNPSKMNAISPQSVGFFICTSEKQVKSVLHYCLRCHCAVPAHMIKQCPC